jgi:ZIP family zinc transporter
MVCLGFLAFYVLEQSARNGAGPHALDAAPAAGLLGATGIGLHSLLDGVAIGEAFHAGSNVGWVVAFAVVVHKFADGVSAISILMSTGQTPRVANVILGMIALAPLVGLALQAFLPLPLYMLALVLGWFAGVFLYLGAAALIPAAHTASHSRWLPAATLAGVALVYIVFRAST